MNEKNVLDEMWALYDEAKKHSDLHLTFSILTEIRTITPQPEPTVPHQ